MAFDALHPSAKAQMTISWIKKKLNKEFGRSSRSIGVEFAKLAESAADNDATSARFAAFAEHVSTAINDGGDIEQVKALIKSYKVDGGTVPPGNAQIEQSSDVKRDLHEN